MIAEMEAPTAGTGRGRRRTPEAERELALTKRAVAGDVAAVSELLGLLRPWLLHQAGQLDRFEPEDLTQDVMIRASRNFHNFQMACSVRTWLYHIMRRLSYNRWHFRRRRGAGHTLSLDAEISTEEVGGDTFHAVLADPGDFRADELELTDLGRVVARAMRRLPQADRDILALRGDCEMSYDDISARTGLNGGTVKSRLSRARRRLLDEIAMEAPEFAAQCQRSYSS